MVSIYMIYRQTYSNPSLTFDILHNNFTLHIQGSSYFRRSLFQNIYNKKVGAFKMHPLLPYFSKTIVLVHLFGQYLVERRSLPLFCNLQDMYRRLGQQLLNYPQQLQREELFPHLK